MCDGGRTCSSCSVPPRPPISFHVYPISQQQQQPQCMMSVCVRSSLLLSLVLFDTHPSSSSSSGGHNDVVVVGFLNSEPIIMGLQRERAQCVVNSQLCTHTVKADHKGGKKPHSLSLLGIMSCLPRISKMFHIPQLLCVLALFERREDRREGHSNGAR